MHNTTRLIPFYLLIDFFLIHSSPHSFLLCLFFLGGSALLVFPSLLPGRTPLPPLLGNPLVSLRDCRRSHPMRPPSPGKLLILLVFLCTCNHCIVSQSAYHSQVTSTNLSHFYTLLKLRCRHQPSLASKVVLKQPSSFHYSFVFLLIFFPLFCHVVIPCLLSCPWSCFDMTVYRSIRLRIRPI